MKMEFSNICRICLESLEQKYDIFESYYYFKKHKVFTKYLYSDMLSQCTKLQPHYNDGLPRHICRECSRQLKKTYTFNLQCVKSDEKLRNYLDIKPEVGHYSGQSHKHIEFEVKIEENEENEINENSTGDEINEKETEKLIVLVNNEKHSNNIVKLEQECDNVNDNNFWDAEDNSLLTEIKKNKLEEQDEAVVVQLTKKRGRKKKVQLNGEMTLLPDSKLPHQCDICGKFLSNKSNLKAHKICHTDLRPYKCSQCSATFRGHSALFQHNKIHTGEKGYHCEYCPKQFSRRSGLVNHIRMHTGEKLYSCEICCKAFVQSAQLSIHMKRHKGDKSYLCQECGKGFPIKSELKVHQRIHNGEKPYSCHLCTKTFATSGNLKIHVRIHNKEIRYNCKECQRGFVTCSAYNVHVKRHKGQRDYHCECGKTFYTSSALKQHRVVHTGEKKYQCKICDRKFTQTSHLSRHFKRDHAKPNAPIPSSDYYKLVINDPQTNVFDNHVDIDVTKMMDPQQNINHSVKCEGS